MGAFDVVGVFCVFRFHFLYEDYSDPAVTFFRSVAVENIENPFGYPTPVINLSPRHKSENYLSPCNSALLFHSLFLPWQWLPHLLRCPTIRHLRPLISQRHQQSLNLQTSLSLRRSQSQPNPQRRSQLHQWVQ
jgi:hypothetical protein